MTDGDRPCSCYETARLPIISNKRQFDYMLMPYLWAFLPFHFKNMDNSVCISRTLSISAGRLCSVAYTIWHTSEHDRCRSDRGPLTPARPARRVFDLHLTLSLLGSCLCMALVSSKSALIHLFAVAFDQ